MPVSRRNFATGALSLLGLGPGWKFEHHERLCVVRPPEYHGALRNPLKGLRAGDPATARTLPYATLAKSYIRWSSLESNAADGFDRIHAFCDKEWAGLSLTNTKVVPRVYLDWPPNGHYWPSDLPQGQYETLQFKQRAVRLIEKLGACWDDDPRVAFIETGLIGLWGEQHDPAPSTELQQVLGDAFTRSFHHKLLMNRYPGHFEKYAFGIYWDSFGHKEEIPTHLPLLTSERLRSRWKTAPMGGETAFDWGTPLGKDPTDAVVHNADRIIALIRQLHWNHLGWLSNYDQTNEVAVANAARIQEALGYRFVLQQVQYPQVLHRGRPFPVSVALRNTGSSPLYYRWPVEVSLMDPSTCRPVWKQTFEGVDLRTLLPGATLAVSGMFACPDSLPSGQFLLALSILDPAGRLPAVRFATEAYLQGGRHPVGWIGVDRPPSPREMPAFTDPGQDHTLRYLA